MTWSILKKLQAMV